MVAETAIYEDEEGNIWADIVKVQFIGHVAVVNPGTKTFGIGQIDPSFPDVIDLLNSLTMNEGLTQLEKAFPDAVFGDTLRPNVRTGAPVPIPEYSQLVNLRFAAPVFVDSLAAVVAALAAVRYAEGPFIAYLIGDPDDFNYANQWQLQRVNAPWAWDLTHGDADGTPIRVAIPDVFPCNMTEEYRLHMDLRDRLTLRNTCSGGSSTHGVSVASIAGAITNNGWQPVTMGHEDYEYPHASGDSTGVASLGWNLRLNGYAGLSTGFLYAVNNDLGDPQFGFRVISASFVAGGASMEAAVKALLRADVIVVGGAGNGLHHGPPGIVPSVVHPAAYTWVDLFDPILDPDYNEQIGKQVIAAAGTDREDTIISCFNYSPCGDAGQPLCDPLNPAPTDSSFVDIASPAFGLETAGCNYELDSGLTTLYSEYYAPTNETFLTNRFGFAGTSYASPMVAATAALLISVNPDLGPREVYDAITKSAEKVDPTGAAYMTLSNGETWSRRIGYGQLDAYGALKYAIEKWGGTLGGVGDTLTFHEDFDLDPNIELAFRAGTTVRFAPDVTLSADKITAVGTAADSIRFVPLYDLAQHPDSTWVGLIITGSDSFISYAVFEGADVAIDLRGTEVAIDRARFTGNGLSLLTDFTYCPSACIPTRSSFSLSNSRIEAGTGVAIYARHTNGSIVGTIVDGNDNSGLIVDDADLYPFSGNVLTANGNDGSSSVPGLRFLAGADVTMASAFYGSGINHIHDNARHQLRLFAGATVHVGGAGIGGDNAIYRASDPASNARSIYNGTGQKVYAESVYWGTPGSVPANAFFGEVVADFPLFCFPPNACLTMPSGSRSAVRGSGGGTLDVTMADGSIGTNTDNRRGDWKRLLREEIRDTRRRLTIDPTAEGSAGLVLHLAHLQRLDREDELGERSATWLRLVALRRLLDGGSGGMPNGRLLAVATAALHSEVLEALRNGEFDGARSLLARYGPLVEDEGDRLVLALSAVALDEADGDYAGALDRLQSLIAAATDEELGQTLALVAQVVQRRLEAENTTGFALPSNVVATGIPYRFALEPAYPNPFNPTATIPFALPEAAHVTLTVYDVLGRQIAILADGRFEAGRHEFTLDGSRLASGLYLVRALMEPEGGSTARAFTQRLTLLK